MSEPQWHHITDYIPAQGDVLQVPIPPDSGPVFVRTRAGRRPGLELCGADRARVPTLPQILAEPFELVADSFVAGSAQVTCAVEWTGEYDLEFSVNWADIYVALDEPLARHKAKSQWRRLVGTIALGMWILSGVLDRTHESLAESHLQEAEVFLDAALDCQGWSDAFRDSITAETIYRSLPRYGTMSAELTDRVSHILQQALKGGCPAGQALGTHVEIPNWR